MGTGDTTKSKGLPPQVISSLSRAKNIVGVSAGMYCSFAITPDSVWAWGYNRNGRLGIGTEDLQTLPVQVSTLDNKGIKQLAAYTHVVARTESG